MSERPCGAPWPFLILLIAFPFKGGNVALMQRACSAIVRNHAFQTRRPVRRVNRKITGQGNVWQRNGKRRWRHYSFAIPFSFGFLKSKSRQFISQIIRDARRSPEISAGGRSAATPTFQNIFGWDYNAPVLQIRDKEFSDECCFRRTNVPSSVYVVEKKFL